MKSFNIKQIFSCVVMGISVTFMGLLLIPIGIFVVLLNIVWALADKLLAWLKKGKKDIR